MGLKNYNAVQVAIIRHAVNAHKVASAAEWISEYAAKFKMVAQEHDDWVEYRDIQHLEEVLYGEEMMKA